MTRGVCAGLVAAGVLTACSSSPAAFGPTGVDELTIPTPSPDQADFTGRVDNPWFPLAPGTRWTYRRYSVSGSQVLVATAHDLGRPVAAHAAGDEGIRRAVAAGVDPERPYSEPQTTWDRPWRIAS